MSNFYSWMFSRETIALDENTASYRIHPDGTLCYAKNIEDCPIFNAIKKADEADDIRYSENLPDGVYTTPSGRVHYIEEEVQEYGYQQLDKEKDKELIEKIRPQMSAFSKAWKDYNTAWLKYQYNKGNGQLKEDLQKAKKEEGIRRREIKKICEENGLVLNQMHKQKAGEIPYVIRKVVKVGTKTQKRYI